MANELMARPVIKASSFVAHRGSSLRFHGYRYRHRMQDVDARILHHLEQAFWLEKPVVGGTDGKENSNIGNMPLNRVVATE